jgi:hypothetical protein
MHQRYLAMHLSPIRLSQARQSMPDRAAGIA